MKQKLPAILITLLLLIAAILFIVWQSKSNVAAGEEAWAEVAICPAGVEDKSVVPDDLANYLEPLRAAASSELIAERVATLFENVMPKRVCVEQLKSVRVERLTGNSNRIGIYLATDNPLVGTAVLYELMIRVEREFIASTSRLGTEQSDLIELQRKQIEFQTRIMNTQQELNTLMSTADQSPAGRSKIDLLQTQLGQLEETDRLMSAQLKELETMGEDMTFEAPLLEWHVHQAPTFDRVSFRQIQDYDVLQGQNRSLLSPLTPAMQNALSGGTGFTVE